MNFNDNVFINIAKIIGYELDKETIETVNYDKEELYSESESDFSDIPNKITCYVGLVKEVDNFAFSVYIDQENPTTEGVVEVMTIDTDATVVCIDRNIVKEAISCLTTKDI
ncbi:MAG: hypothetical protein ACRC5T_12110 [Cetobacterium sp.]